MDPIKIEPFCDPVTEQRENLLFLLGKMREMQAAREGQTLKRMAGEDQPLDFSAPAKNPRLSPDWLGQYPDNKHDTLGSDGVSDVSSHSPGSNSGQSDSGREPRPGSTSPPRPALPRLNIPDSPRSHSDVTSSLLTTVTAQKHPLLRPLSSLIKQDSQELNPLLSLANIAPSDPVNLPLPFNLPVFPQTVKPSFVSSLPFSYQPSSNPAQEMNKISLDSQGKYAEFREKMMKNLETSKKTKKQEETPGTPTSKNVDSSLDLTPTHHSTPRDGKDAAYWERRRKNNEAAKRSRDARRLKENEVAVRASFLEQENIQLKMELVQLRTELGAMRDQVNRRPL